MGNGGVALVADEPAGFREFDGGALGIASQSVGSGNKRAKLRVCRSGVARLLGPDQRVFAARLQEMRGANSRIKQSDLGIAWTETDGLLLSRDQRIQCARHEFAPAEMRVGVGPVAIECKHGFVLGN